MIYAYCYYGIYPGLPKEDFYACFLDSMDLLCVSLYSCSAGNATFKLSSLILEIFVRFPPFQGKSEFL